MKELLEKANVNHVKLRKFVHTLTGEEKRKIHVGIGLVKK